MSPSPYLDLLDETLRAGLQRASPAFVDAQLQFIAGRQQPDGGFCGRHGGSDLYYTDFAVRSLTLLAPDHAALARVPAFLRIQAGRAASVVDCFNLLQIARLLGLASASYDQTAAFRVLHTHLLPRGGLRRISHDRQPSTYATFLGQLCFDMLGVPLPNVDAAVQTIAALRQPDGGFAESPGQSVSQTSATAAAAAFLLRHDALSKTHARAAADFLAQMQTPDGGLRPHGNAAGGDLLSTFTGLVTLAAFAGLPRLDAAALARFLRETAHRNGGFTACVGDDDADVEYTYYGLGVFALLRAMSPHAQTADAAS